MGDTRSLTTELYNVAQAEPVTWVTESPVQKPSGADAWWVHGTGDTGSVYHALGAVDAEPMVSQALTADRIHGCGFRTGRGGRIDQFAIRVTAGVANAKVRIAIYDVNEASLYPSRLWFCSDELDGSAAAVVTADVSLVLPPNKLMFVGVLSGHNPTLRAHNSISLYPHWGCDSTLPQDSQVAIRATFTYAKAPEQFPKGATFLTNNDGDVPAVFARFK